MAALPPTAELPVLDFDTVTLTGVTKVFGPTRALSDVSLELRGGTLTVLRGPNGSGKSTLLQILSTLMAPTTGAVRYGSATTAATGGGALRARIGVLSHASHLYLDLTPRENLVLRARLHGLELRTSVASALDRLDIVPFAERSCRALSRGQLQRVALAACLLHVPRLILLDEPTTGLDADSVDRLAETLGAARARGGILLLSTHDQAFADRIADRQVRLERGRVV